jgi:acyl dehydratase
MRPQGEVTLDVSEAYEKLTMARLSANVGRELGVSSWFVVDQDRIDRFAECTDDRQWIHVEPVRAATDGPFGGPVAHGYLTLSLLTPMQRSAGAIPEDAAAVINYGIERVRFIGPVRAGARIRNRVKLEGMESRPKSAWLARLENTVEVEGEVKPALVATTILMLVA